MKKIAFIHGLNSSHRSFGYLDKSLHEHESILIDYTSQSNLQHSIDQVLKKLPKHERITLIGHSLGGLIATVIAAEEQERVEALVTISTPHAGSRAARVLRWLPGSFNVLADITPDSDIVKRCQALKLTIPTLNIVSTGGHLPTSPELNDGIIAISSQKALKFGKKVEVKANHFEILLDDRTVKHINNFIFEDIK